MFILDGNVLPLDVAFTVKSGPAAGNQYPANFLRLSTPEERAAIGIVEQPDVNQTYDQRYYWGYDENGVLIPKQLEDQPILDENGEPTGNVQTGLKTNLIQEQKQIANSLLASTDWYVIRKLETGVDVPVAVLSYRENVRAVCAAREAAIASVANVDELHALLYAQPTITQPSADEPDRMETIENPDPFIAPWPQL